MENSLFDISWWHNKFVLQQKKKRKRKSVCFNPLLSFSYLYSLKRKEMNENKYIIWHFVKSFQKRNIFYFDHKKHYHFSINCCTPSPPLPPSHLSSLVSFKHFPICKSSKYRTGEGKKTAIQTDISRETTLIFQYRRFGNPLFVLW